MRGYLPESQYDTKTREVLDDFYPRTLQWCSTDPRPENLTSLDNSKCYPSILIDNKHPIPLYTIHDVIEPFNGAFDSKDMLGKYYRDEYVFDRMGEGIEIEAGFYGEQLVNALIKRFKMPTSNVKRYIHCRKTLSPDTFKNFLIALFTMFPESQAKLLANSYIGELGRKYSCKDHGFTCNSLDTAQCIWTSALAKNGDVMIDSYQNQTPSKNCISLESARLNAYFLTTHQSTGL